MSTKQNNSGSIASFLMWLVWIFTATIIMGGAIYLFVGGSMLFNHVNTEPIIMYRELSEGKVAFTGSIVKQAKCQALSVDSFGDANGQELAFTFEDVLNCENNVNDIGPETFFVEIDGNKDTQISVTVNKVKRDFIIK